MKLFSIIFFGLITLKSFTQSGFSGIITMSTTNKEIDEKATVKCYISNGNSKMEFQGTADGINFQHTLIFLAGNRNATYLAEVEGKKVKYEIPVMSLKPQQNFFSESFLEPLNENEYMIENMNYSTRVVLMEEEFNYKDLPSFLRKSPILILLESNGIKRLPKEIITKDVSGTIVFSQIIENIIVQSISSETFEIPSGFQPFSESFITVE